MNEMQKLLMLYGEAVFRLNIMAEEIAELKRRASETTGDPPKDSAHE